MSKPILRPLALAASAVLLVSACDQPPITAASLDSGSAQMAQGPAPLREGHPVWRAIDEVLVAWGNHFNAGDFAGLGALYTEDSRLFGPGVEMVEGRAGIAAYFQGLTSAYPPGTRARLRAVEVEHYGHTVVAVLRIEAWLDGSLIGSGSGIKIFKRDRGQWSIHRSVFKMD